MPAQSHTGELRALCLAQVDPTLLATMAPERLIVEVERVLAEIATDRRIQLNGREQRQLARELVDDMLGLGPLEPLLGDDSITDIMVNGPDRVFVERGGKMVLSGVTFPRRHACRERLPAHRLLGRAARGREQSDGGCAPQGRQPRQHRLPAARPRRPLSFHPQILAAKNRFRRS